MKRLIFLVLFLFVAAPAQAVCGGSSPNLTAATLADLALCITAAVDGDTITLTNGSYTATSTMTISGKGIKITSGGSGRIVARSTSSVTVGTGSKTFALDTCTGVTGTIRATVLYDGTNYLDGTVTSCVGTTLTMDATTATGSGTRNVWVISTVVTTTITNNVTGGPIFNITEDASHSTEITGIKFVLGTGNAQHIAINYLASGKPVIIHDCWASASGSFKMFLFQTRRGLVYNCTFDGTFNSTFPGPISNTQAIGIKWEGTVAGATWATASTMGTADTNGDSNIYIEDNDFHGIVPQALDVDDNGRIVIRYNTFNNSGFVAHGQDTSPYGVRHYETYNNTFIYNTNGDSRDFNMSSGYFFARGGTGVWTNNSMDDVNSAWWGNPSEVTLTIQHLRRNAGCCACETGGTPACRQVGFGYITGAGPTKTACETANVGAGYEGDLEPFYFWNNTGTIAIGLSDYSPDECSGGPAVSSFIRSGTEYYPNTTKPGWTAKTYPHTLRGVGSGCVASLGVSGYTFSGGRPGASSSTGIQLSNTGDASCTISSISINSTNPPIFTQTNDCGGTLAASATCTITITFVPNSSSSMAQHTLTVDVATGTDDTCTLDGTGLTIQSTRTPTIQ